jgi:hypothetical protein
MHVVMLILRRHPNVVLAVGAGHFTLPPLQSSVPSTPLSVGTATAIHGNNSCPWSPASSILQQHAVGSSTATLQRFLLLEWVPGECAYDISCAICKNCYIIYSTLRSELYEVYGIYKRYVSKGVAAFCDDTFNVL